MNRARSADGGRRNGVCVKWSGFVFAQRILYVCIVSMDQPGRVANPARRQLNRENQYFPVRVRA